MIPITLTFLEPADLPPLVVASTLTKEGFDSRSVTLQELSAAPPARPSFAYVIVFSQFEPSLMDKALRRLGVYVKGCGGDPGRIIACGRDLFPQDEEELRGLGAGKVVQPESWTAEAVAQRLLAALYGGFTAGRAGQQAVAVPELNDGERPYLECEVPFKSGTERRRIIGATRVMRDLFDDIKVCGGSRDPVLIWGETGTGKELVAAAIHSSNEANKAKKYIAINIAEIGPDVLTSELFGHVRGAFTGAEKNRQGLLVEAGDGTVFVDEIGDLDLHNQARLLRVFENRQIRPVGAMHKDIDSFEARLIFATHRPLEQMCWDEQFREDLYQRIVAGHVLRLPELRKRKGDLELLAKEFFRKWNEEQVECQQATLTLGQSDYDKIVDLCIGQHFSGNVRGLRGILRGCLNFSLKTGRFNFERLRAELLIAQKQFKRAEARADEATHKESRGSSVTFDPRVDKYHDFKRRALVAYCTGVYRAAGKRRHVALKWADVSGKTFDKYLPETEHPRRRSHDVAPADTPAGPNDGDVA